MSTKTTSAMAGIACAAVALGIAELTAAAVSASAAPVVAVGAAAIDATPEPVKEFAISTFGMYDKVALIVGIAAILTVVAVAIGIAARSHVWIGYAGLAAFGLIGVSAALTRPGASAWWALPSVMGTAAAAATLWLLFRRAVSIGDAAPPRPGWTVNRRGVLYAFGAASLSGVVGWRLGDTEDIEQTRQALTLPRPSSVGASARDAALDVDGLTDYLTPNSDFYRVDTVLTFPRVSPQDYQLRIGGRVGQQMSLSYRDILRRPIIEREITLSCVSNEVGGELAGNARWLGISLGDLLREVAPDSGADQLVSRSADGWTCGTPTEVVMDGRDAMLAIGMNGEPLPLRHGFPVRMVVPGLYGYVSATKWLTELELSSFEEFDPYWVQRDWAPRAPIKTFSRIDTPTASQPVKAGRTAVAGVAWAQHRGIAAVEVQVNDGEWQEAELAGVISSDTWRQWVWEWDAPPGRHTLRVRATDNTGETQTSDRRPPLPDGATGWHSVVVNAE